MRILLRKLLIRTRQTIEEVSFSESVTFLYGPVSTGKSTIARMVDYCFGGELERTPAIQQEWVSAQLSVALGEHECILERGAHDNQTVRVTWTSATGNSESLNAPLVPQPSSLVADDVYTLSDLVFYLCGVSPIKVRQRTRDPNSPLVRLSIRDLFWYCYLEQTHLDSSFFRLEDPFRGRKSQDAMRFFTGLHSERLSQLETDYAKTLDDQRVKREAVVQVRAFMQRFELGSEIDLAAQLEQVRSELAAVESRRAQLEEARTAATHPSDLLRQQLRKSGAEIADVLQAIGETKEALDEQRALRAEFITAKLKAERIGLATEILESVRYEHCPECGANISGRQASDSQCGLCGSDRTTNTPSLESEALRRDLNDRIDQLADSIARREREIARLKRQLPQLQQQKREQDQQLQRELARYDSAYVESIRAVEREMATLEERIKSVQHLQQLPQAIDDLEQQAGALQGQVDLLRSLIVD